MKANAFATGESTASVSFATVSSSMSITGSRMEKSVSPKPGAVIPSRPSVLGIGGGCASTSRTARRAKIGPATIAVGMPMRKPHISTSPIFGFSPNSANFAIAATGPGCGGITPCITERHDNSGIVSMRKGVFVSAVSVSKIGSSNTNPTANQVGNPTAIASAMMHQITRFGPKNAANRFAKTTAPPDSTSSFPSIVPSPSTVAIPPSDLPSPAPNASTAFTIVSGSFPPTGTIPMHTAPAPTMSEARISARKAFIFHRVTKSTSAPTAASARMMRDVSWVVMVCGKEEMLLRGGD